MFIYTINRIGKQNINDRYPKNGYEINRRRKLSAIQTY
jgi:hypothetical protein